jgi:large subunit ribosomal protein L25
MDFVTREVEVECLPDKIPTHLTVDVEALHTNQHVEAGELELPEGVELQVEPSRVIVAVATRRGGLEEEEEVEEEGLEPISAEPELIKRGKAEEGEEG